MSIEPRGAGRRTMPTLSMLVLLAFSAIASGQTFELPVVVRDAPDGALLLRAVVASAQADAVAVSGRVRRTRMTRAVAGRAILVTLRAQDGTLRASQRIAVDAARLPRYGPALLRFKARLPAAAARGDTVTVAILPVGVPP